MTEQEIARLVISIAGDNSNYRAILHQAIQETKQAGTQFNDVLRSTEAMHRVLIETERRANQEAKELKSSQEGLAHAYRETEKVYRMLETSSERYSRKVRELAELHEIGALDALKFAQAVEQIGRAHGMMGPSDKKIMLRQAMTPAAGPTGQQQLDAAMLRAAQIYAETEHAADRYARKVAEIGDVARRTGMDQETLNRAIGIAGQELEQTGGSLFILGSGMQQLGFVITAVGGMFTAAAAAAVKSSLDIAGGFEQTEMAFEAFLGSSAAMESTMARLKTFAVNTPFEFKEVSEAARTLVVFGEEGDKMMETLSAMGNASAATGSDLGLITLVLNQIRGAGQLMMQDFRQLATRGVLSLQDLADHFDVTIQKVQEMQTAGEISFEDVRQTLIEMSQDGGRFANMMEKMSDTLIGQFKKLADNITFVGLAIGEALLPYVKSAVEWGNSWLNWFRELDPWAMKLIAGTLALSVAFGTIVTVLGTLLIFTGQLVIAYGAITSSAALATLANVPLVASMWAGVTGALSYTASLFTLAGAMDALITAAAGASVAISSLMAAAPLLLGLSLALGAAFYLWGRQVDDFNNAMERAGNLNNQLLSKEGARNQGILDQGNKLGSDKEKRSFFGEELAKAEQELAGLDGQVKNSQKVVADLEPTMWSLGQAGKKVWEQEKAELEGTMKRYDQQKEHVNKLRDALAEVSQQQQDDKAKEFIGKLEDQIKYFGVSAEQAEVYRMAAEGVNEELVQSAQALVDEKKALEDNKKATEEAEKAKEKFQETVNSTISNLEKEIEIMKMEAAGVENANEVYALNQLIKDGLSVTEQARIENLMKEKQALEDAKEAEKERNKLLDEGKRKMEEYMTPIEKYEKALRDLEKLKDVGAIDDQTAKRGMDAAHKEFEKATREADKLKQKVKEVKEEFVSNNIVRAGSKELYDLQQKMMFDQGQAAKASEKERYENMIKFKQDLAIAEQEKEVQAKLDQERRDAAIVAGMNLDPNATPANFDVPGLEAAAAHNIWAEGADDPSNVSSLPQNQELTWAPVIALLERIAKASEKTEERLEETNPIPIELTNIFGN